jgi:cyclic pyranopterin phosphate synthase
MPEANYVWLPRAAILTFEEIDRLVGVYASLGVSKIRLTGGEPLLRHDMVSLVRMIHRRDAIRDIALTTNGILLAQNATTLKDAGLTRINVSLDTLQPERMKQFAQSARHADVLEGIAAAQAAGFEGIKVNSVIIRGFNDDELVPLLEFGRERGVELRFIEYMDVGGATGWSMADVVSRKEMLERLSSYFGPIEPQPMEPGNPAPAERFRLSDGTRFGIIASTTEPFCRTCDRARLTADGVFLLCLYAAGGLDLRAPLRDGATDQELAELIRAAWSARNDRGAELRAGEAARGALYQVSALRADPHKEMHTRGG